MKEKSLFYRLTLGLLIGAMIMPAQPARAQFGGVVFDPKNFAENVAKRLADAKRFAQTFDNAVKQYTTLRGVLAQAEDLVAKQRNAIQTMANIGRTVRASLQLKDQVQAIVKTRLTMLKSIDDRLRRGILDPEADLRDLEDYLSTSIGRSSQDSLANLGRLRKMDNTLERLYVEWEKLRDAKAAEKDEMAMMIDRLAEIESRPESASEAESHGVLVQKIADSEALIAQYNAKMEELWSRIEERTQKYQAMMDERYKFAERVNSTNKAWSDFNDELDKIQKTLYSY
jgi:chromosome segregation ATPase